MLQQINNRLALVQANSSLAQPTSSERTQSKPWTDSTEKLVILLFTRLTDLFAHKAASVGLIIYQDAEKGIYSSAFELWCRKLTGLTPNDFKTGMAGLEAMAQERYRQGEQMWPPSYAEFLALCFPKHDRDTLAHKPFERLPALEDKTAKTKRYELGKQKSAELLEMLGSKPTEIKTHDNSHAQAALAEAERILARG